MNMLRQATPEDYPRLHEVYADAMAQADSHGHPSGWTISEAYFDYLGPKLHVSVGGAADVDGSRILGAVVLTDQYNDKEWAGTEPESGLYIGKWATSRAAHERAGAGKSYATEVMLPEIAAIARELGKSSVRLNFLTPNDGLSNLYTRMGFQEAGRTTFFSPRHGHDLTTTNMILDISRSTAV